MLEKIIKIKNVGRFRDYGASGNVTFRKLTLIYAENGRGKTTLCAVLRSLQNGQPELIAERKTLAATEPAFVHMRLNETDHKFMNNTWTQQYPDIIIFDPVFVSDNVYSGNYVEHEHKKNLYRIVVGEQGVQLAKQIEEFDGKIRDLNTDLRTKKESVSKNLPSGINFEDYLAWQPAENIDIQIQRETEELSKRQTVALKAGEIKSKGFFQKVQLPVIPFDFTAVLSKQLTDITADAEAKVRQQIARHQMGNQGESWLSQGMGFIKDDRCPFCGQDVMLNDMLASYRSHFNEAYRTLKDEVAQLGERINSAIGESALFAVQQIISDNQSLAEFWKQFMTVDLPDISMSKVQERYISLRESCLTIATRKKNSPTERIATDETYSSALAGVETLKQSVVQYNEAVEKLNALISEQKAAAQREGELTVLKNELSRLQARKRRFDLDVMRVCQAYRDAVTAKDSLEQRKLVTRQELDGHCQTILQSYENSINDFLDQFNAGFRITNTRHLYTGGTPSSHYKIEINNTAVELGDTRTQSGTPCFKTTLSSGDRRALALAFFLAVLEKDRDITRKLVVFDDPFTSLDRFRRTCTQQMIQRLSESARQVIILSHDPLFLKLIVDECPSANTDIKTLQMSKAGDTTVIGEWDVHAEVQSSYMKDYATLLWFYRERRGDPRAVARTIRPFLEGMLRSHFPGHFQQNEWLGDFINKIRVADAISGLQHAKADLGKFDAINGYSKKYHHQQNANADSEPINDDELHGYVKRTLRLVGGC